MSWNSGAGSPHYFRCSQCRRNRPFVLDRRAIGDKGFVSAVRLTGRTKERGHAHRRNGTTLREYRCGDCGHIGWSSHNELARALPLEQHTAQNIGFMEVYGGHGYGVCTFPRPHANNPQTSGPGEKLSDWGPCSSGG